MLHRGSLPRIDKLTNLPAVVILQTEDSPKHAKAGAVRTLVRRRPGWGKKRMRLYLTRHGQTDWNVQHKVQGQTDIPLNETGIRQAHELADTLEGKPIDLALVSPLLRARETCEIVCGQLQIPFRVCGELTEQNFGIFEGVSTRDPVYQTEKAKYFTRFPEGESFLDVTARIYPFLRRIAAEYADENVLIIVHNGIGRVIHSFFEDLSNDEFRNFRMENCEVREYDMTAISAGADFPQCAASGAGGAG